MNWCGKATERMERDLNPLLISYEDDCKHDPALLGYDTTLKSMINKAIEGGGAGGGGALGICGQSIKALSYSNKMALEEISSFKENLQNKKGKSSCWRKTRKNEERINLLADQYIINSGELLDFVAEMVSFQRKARDRCTFIKQEVQQYFQMKKAKETNMFSGDNNHPYETESTYYRNVRDRLSALKPSSNIYEPSTERLLATLRSINEKQKVMLDNLKKQQQKLGKKHDLTPWLRRAKNFIFMGTMACMLVAAIVTAALGAEPISGAITSFLPPTISSGHWLNSYLVKLRDSANSKMDLNDCMQQGTRDATRELGQINFLIQKVEIEIDSLMSTPSSTVHEGQIEAIMEHIDSNLQSFFRQIEELEKETDKFSKDIIKARDEVYIRRDRLGYSGSSTLIEQPPPPRRITYLA